jgi:hypothetical protein
LQHLPCNQVFRLRRPEAPVPLVEPPEVDVTAGQFEAVLIVARESGR